MPASHRTRTHGSSPGPTARPPSSPAGIDEPIRMLPHRPACASWCRVAGDGFGPAGHVTTTMCLAAIDRLAGSARRRCRLRIRASCAGVGAHAPPITSSRSTSTRRPFAQTRASVELAGVSDLVEVRRAGRGAGRRPHSPAVSCWPMCPLAAHRALLHAIAEPPVWPLSLSGLRPADAPVIVAATGTSVFDDVRAARRGLRMPRPDAAR